MVNKELQSDCRFCPDYDNSYNSLSEVNAPIFETAHFKAVPDLSPIGEGHILIASKKHTLATSLLGIKERVELKRITQVISDFNNCEHNQITEGFEHGTGACAFKGCVDHMHLHLLAPGKEGAKSKVEKILDLKTTSFEAMDEIQMSEYGYFLFADKDGQLFYDTPQTPLGSQWGRQVYSYITGVPWDWRSNLKINPDQLKAQIASVRKHYDSLKKYWQQRRKRF